MASPSCLMNIEIGDLWMGRGALYITTAGNKLAWWTGNWPEEKPFQSKPVEVTYEQT